MNLHERYTIPLLESGDESSTKDGGVVFQAIISHDLSWNIVNGQTQFDQKKINSKLHQVNIFPDMKYESGEAMSTYYILSEVNILKRKFDMASEVIKKMISPMYEAEISKDHTKYLELSKKYFDNTSFSVSFNTNKLVLREVSTSGLDNGSPEIVLKISTGMVDNLNGKPTPTWEAFSVQVVGHGKNINITEHSTIPISQVREYDYVENKNDKIFQTILPSVYLTFKGQRAQVQGLGKIGSEEQTRLNKSKIDSLFNVTA